MYNLGDEITYKNIKGVVVDEDNQVIFDDDKFFFVDFKECIFIEEVFDDIEDLLIYLDILKAIDSEIIDARISKEFKRD